MPSQIPGSGDDGRPLFAKFGRTATPGSGMAARTATTTRCRPPSTGASRSGLFLKGAYTYSHAIDEAEYSDWTEYTWNAPSAFNRNHASTAFNIPHMFQLAYVYELPFGNGKKWAQSGAAKAVLGGWQINGIFSAYQGRQFTLSASGSSLNMPGNAQTPDQIKPMVDNSGWSAMTAPASTPAHLRGSRRSGSATWAGTPCAGPAW